MRVVIRLYRVMGLFSDPGKLSCIPVISEIVDYHGKHICTECFFYFIYLFFFFWKKPTTKFRVSFRPMGLDCISNSYSMVCLPVRGDNP